MDLSDAESWIRRHVEVLALEVTHSRPWSTVVCVTTPDGHVWFKANAPQFRYEAELVALLAERRPDCIDAPIAIDTERGWLLLRDAGVRLRELVTAERSLERWLDVLPLYTSVQRDLTGDVELMLSLGVPDLRLERLPPLFEELLEVLPQAQAGRWRARLPEIVELRDRLAAFRIPATIQHDDFHDAQVFVRDGRYLLLDWGDACVTHPFFTLSVTLEGVIGWGPDDVQDSVDTAPYRDAYLAGFDGEGLEEAVAIALRLGWVCRAVNGHVQGDVEPTLRRLAMV